MSGMTIEHESVEEPAGSARPSAASDERLVTMLADWARGGGLRLSGGGGLLRQLVKWVLESALEGGITGHADQEKHDPAGRNNGNSRNSRNGTRAKTVLTDAGPVEAGDFQEAGSRKHPAIIKLWENAWGESVPFLSFDVEVRKAVCSTNAIESVDARIRKAVRARGRFPDEAAALRCVYVALMSLAPTGRGRRRWTMRRKATSTCSASPSRADEIGGGPPAVACDPLHAHDVTPARAARDDGDPRGPLTRWMAPRPPGTGAVRCE